MCDLLRIPIHSLDIKVHHMLHKCLTGLQNMQVFKKLQKISGVCIIFTDIFSSYEELIAKLLTDHLTCYSFAIFIFFSV